MGSDVAVEVGDPGELGVAVGAAVRPDTVVDLHKVFRFTRGKNLFSLFQWFDVNSVLQILQIALEES